jgi:hypothetical protein
VVAPNSAKAPDAAKTSSDKQKVVPLPVQKIPEQRPAQVSQVAKKSRKTSLVDLLSASQARSLA